jgi:uncharacterized protein YciI
MKHFIILLKYLKPIEEIDKYVQSHRDYLQKGYDSKILLMSGPLVPREGGVIIARANDLEEIQSFCNQDPFSLEGCAAYHFIEFQPVKQQVELSNWIQI